jgi:AbrB family looped-hinge helix DNA binding protein
LRELIELTFAKKKINWQREVKMELILDRFGRVVLPKALRKDFNLHAGSRLLVKEKGREIILQPEDNGNVCSMKNGTLVFTGTAVGDITGEIDRLREERAEAVGGL